MSKRSSVDAPGCECFPPGHKRSEPGAIYTHLGYAKSLEDLRANYEMKTGLTGNAIRIEKVVYTGKEGKTTSGCPLAKWIIRRSGADEKLLIIVKNRRGHTCATAWIVIVIVKWEGVPSHMADDLYQTVTDKLRNNRVVTQRGCSKNKPKTCACQGLDQSTCGASFSFGCSWQMFNNGCKFARSKTIRKFKLSNQDEEQCLEYTLQNLATFLAPICKTLAPDSYANMTQHEDEAGDCRLGLEPGRPWSGVTTCLDFCAHAHRDVNNMKNGCTMMVTLTKYRGFGKPDDEQLHVLPLFVMDNDEFGSKEAREKVQSGAIEVLSKFPCEVRTLQSPLKSSRRVAKKRKAEDEHAECASASIRRLSLDCYPDSPHQDHTPTSNSNTPKQPHTSGVEPQNLLGSVTDFINNEECFKDPGIGGVAIALSHGAVTFEVAKHELHATTALRVPNRLQPTRISLVYYQHMKLNKADHGRGEWKEKRRSKKELADEQQQQVPSGSGSEFSGGGAPKRKC